MWRALTPSALALRALGLLSLSLVVLGCNKHVFEVQIKDCAVEEQLQLDVDLGAPIDILFVVDDSGSMLEEQEALADGFYRETCPFLTQAVPYVPDEYRNPTDAQLAQLADRCGFIQIQGAYERDFHVGITTTTVDECDNRYGLAPEGWGRRPRRGCLITAGDDDQRFVKWGDDALAERFRANLAQVGTWGSVFERGLDSAALFFDPRSDRAPGCEADLASFRRPGADLAVVFLTDEDDCSRDGPLPANAERLVDELGYRQCDVEAGAAPADDDELQLNGGDCYSTDVALADVGHYAAALTRAAGAGALRVAVIGGAGGGANNAAPAGCIASAAGPDTACFESGGLSNVEGICGADARAGLAPCCEADAAHRYFQLGDVTGDEVFLGDSLCSPSFSDTLVRVAAFLARSDSLQLSEPPANPAAIVVRVRRVDGSIETIPRGEGWTLDGVRIRFTPAWVPRPGERVTVAALSTRDTDLQCAASVGPTAP
jgi:hypothetical protein